VQRRNFFSTMSLLALGAAEANAFGFGSIESKFINFFATEEAQNMDMPKSKPSKKSEKLTKETKSLSKLQIPVQEKSKVVLSGDEFALLKSLHARLKRVRYICGYGHFNLVGIDEMNKIARNYSKVGSFTKAELDMIERLFYEEASEYGFYGEKVLTNITDNINKKEITKVPRTGHYLFRGKPEQMYHQIRSELGDSVILTSGVRSIIKQLYLFTNKAVKTNGDLSLASHSLAPIGYSYHGIGDFDVGKVGFGMRNFTDAFSKTEEYKKLIDSGYVKIRYPQGNPYGVRFEPWHIKVV